VLLDPSGFITGQGCAASSYAPLAAFARRWIDSHDDIGQTGYKKACIKTAIDSGLALGVVFYSKKGTRNHHRLQTEFMVALMAVWTQQIVSTPTSSQAA
jgi:hypothetical protein